MNDEEKKQVSAERKRILAARAKRAQSNDPMVRVRFQNIEDPPSPGRPSPPLSFSFGDYVFKESRKAEEEDTALRHGKYYDLPMSVVNHLNSLKVPVYGTEKDPNTGAIKSVISNYSNRFSCVPVDMGPFAQTDAEPPATRRGRPPKEVGV